MLAVVDTVSVAMRMSQYMTITVLKPRKTLAIDYICPLLHFWVVVDKYLNVTAEAPSTSYLSNTDLSTFTAL